jgi:hypothetical protein
MALTTPQVMIVLLLVIGVIIGIWLYVVAQRYSNYLDEYSYSRGAHAWQTGQTLDLKCDDGKEICVYRATQICTNPDSNNFESAPDSIASGNTSNVPYGAFDPDTTVSRTEDMGKKCNGLSSATFVFNPVDFSGGKPWEEVCSAESTSQLIATYTCIPKGSKCTSAS